MAKKPKLSGSTIAVMRRPNPKRKPSSWKLLWPTMKYGWNYFDYPDRRKSVQIEEGA